MTPDFAPSNLIFTKADGKPINPSSFSSRYAFVRKKLGITTTFHMLRHDMASRMKKARLFDLKDIQAQLGHSSIHITMDIYTHIDEDEKQEVSNWLESGINEILGGGSKKCQPPDRRPAKISGHTLAIHRIQLNNKKPREKLTRP